MASAVSIANRALQKVGAARISALDENSKSAREVANCYDTCLGAELEVNAWRFAVKRAVLTAQGTAPAFGPRYKFTLPPDFKKLLPSDPLMEVFPDDWLLEGSAILTDDPGPLYIRYVSSDAPENRFPELFAEALAARIALEIVEPLTQSDSKKANLEDNYLYHINMARRTNAIEMAPTLPEVSSWTTVRY